MSRLANEAKYQALISGINDLEEGNPAILGTKITDGSAEGAEIVTSGVFVRQLQAAIGSVVTDILGEDATVNKAPWRNLPGLWHAHMDNLSFDALDRASEGLAVSEPTVIFAPAQHALNANFYGACAVGTNDGPFWMKSVDTGDDGAEQTLLEWRLATAGVDSPDGVTLAKYTVNVPEANPEDISDELLLGAASMFGVVYQGHILRGPDGVEEYLHHNKGYDRGIYALVKLAELTDACGIKPDTGISSADLFSSGSLLQAVSGMTHLIVHSNLQTTGIDMPGDPIDPNREIEFTANLDRSKQERLPLSPTIADWLVRTSKLPYAGEIANRFADKIAQDRTNQRWARSTNQKFNKRHFSTRR